MRSRNRHFPCASWPSRTQSQMRSPVLPQAACDDSLVEALAHRFAPGETHGLATHGGIAGFLTTVVKLAGRSVSNRSGAAVAGPCDVRPQHAC